MESTPEPTVSSANRQIARAAGTVMVAMVFSNLIGLLAKRLVGLTFGTGPTSEAFYAAIRLPEILFNLVAGGALASAFIPTFSGLLAKEERENAWKLASSLANLVTIILCILCLLASIFANQFVQVIAPGFTNPAQRQLTADLLRLLLPSSIIFGLSGLVMGLLNIHQIFLFPALAPAMYQIGWIIGVELFAPRYGVYGLAWGVVFGAGLHLLVQLPFLLRLPKLRYSPTLGLKLPEVREVVRLMGPRLFGVAVVQLNFLLNTNLASYQPDGSIPAINMAFPLMLMPEAAIAQSIAVAALPTFSLQVARGRPDEMRTSMAATLRSVLLLAIPVSMGLILLRTPLVAMVYQGQAFTSQSTDMVAWALLWYAAGLVGHCVVEIVSRAFYALHDTKTPVLIGAAAMTLNLAFSLLFSAVFSAIGWMPHGGLAFANSLATGLESAGLLFIMRRRLKGLLGWHILGAVWKSALATLVMSLCLVFFLNRFGAHSAWMIALGGTAIGGTVYAIIISLLKVEEVGHLAGWLRAKILRQSK